MTAVPDDDVYNEQFEIAKQLMAGNETNLDRLNKLFARTLGAWLKELLPACDRAWTEDILQELLIKLITQIRSGRNTFNDSNHFKNWLYATARCIVIDYIRKKFIKKGKSETPDSSLPAPRQPSDETQGLEFVWNCIDRLPLPDRAVFFMRHYWSFEYEEIQALMKTLKVKVKTKHRTVEALRQLVHRTRESIAACLVSKAAERCYELAGPLAIRGLEQYAAGGRFDGITAAAADLNDLWWASDLVGRALAAEVHPVPSKQSQQCLAAAGGQGCTSADAYQIVTRGLLFLGETPCVRFPRSWRVIDPPDAERQIDKECLMEIVLLFIWGCIVLGRPAIPQNAGCAAVQLISQCLPQRVAKMLTTRLRSLWLLP